MPTLSTMLGETPRLPYPVPGEGKTFVYQAARRNWFKWASSQHTQGRCRYRVPEVSSARTSNVQSQSNPRCP